MARNSAADRQHYKEVVWDTIFGKLVRCGIVVPSGWRILGAWIGGIVVSRNGDYALMWYADALLAAVAALICLPIKEPASMRG